MTTPDVVRERRLRGGVLLAGAVVVAVLFEGELLARYWFVPLVGVTYLVAAAVSRSRGTLWGPGLVLTTVGVAVALWLRDGRSGDSVQLLALTAMALGLGGVLAALLASARGVLVTPMSVALPVLLFGGFALLEQQGVAPFAEEWPYAALLGAWGLVELVRPARR